LPLQVRAVASAVGEGLTDTWIPFFLTEDHAELSPLEAHFQKTNGFAKFSRRLPEIGDVGADSDVLVSQAERILLSMNTGVNFIGVRRGSANGSGVARPTTTSLMFLRPNDYRGLADKIVSVSVKPLTQG